MKELYQTADWKAEKHVPVIDAPASAKKDEAVELTVQVGKEIAHPNTTEHFIAWLEVYFHPDGEKFPHFLGRYEAGAHGGSPDGPNTSTIYAEPKVTLTFRTGKSGTIHAASYCNVHGLWSGEAKLAVE
jgi:superoxide reductase